MATITLKNIPEQLYEKIKDNARKNRRSINNEIIYRIEKSLNTRIDKITLLKQAKIVREKSGIYLTDEELNSFKNQERK